MLAFLRVRGGEALDQLAGNADDTLGRPETRHLLGFLECDRAVVHHGVDVRHGARLHVRQALAFAPDAAHGAHAVVVDFEDESLDELGPDIEGGAGADGRFFLVAPDPAPESHGHSPICRLLARRP